MFKIYDFSLILWVLSVLKQSRNRISDRWCIIHTFLLISSPAYTTAYTAYTIALKTGTYFGKKCDFLQSNGYVKLFKGAHRFSETILFFTFAPVFKFLAIS